MNLSPWTSTMKDTQAVRLAAAAAAAAAAAGLAWLYWRSGPAGLPLPPGPRGWPLVGCIDILTPDMHLTLTDMGRQYGDVYSFYIGNRLTVVLNSARAIRAAFVQQTTTFASRPRPWVMQLVNVKEEINNGPYTEEWKAERKFANRALREFGYGSDSLDGKISEEIETLLDDYKHKGATPFDPRDSMPKMMANLIFSILINERYEYNDQELATKLGLIREWQERVGEANLLDIFPLLRFLPWKPLRKLREVRHRIVAMYRQHVRDHKATFDDSYSRDVIDVYLRERGRDYDEDRLIGLFFSFAGDAVDSLPEVMVWLVLNLCAYPDVQEKVLKEVNSITETERHVALADRPRMPYAEAVVMETLRLSSFVPISEPHWTLSDTTLFGYRIPKDAAVLGNLYAAHFDENDWENPQSFDPERFIDRDGNVKKPDTFMPYSVGRRMCLGEQLSNKVLFLFLTRLVQTFHVAFTDPSCPPDLYPQRWYVRKAHKYTIRTQHRQ